MIFDTIQYVDGGGATQEIALQLANVAGGPAGVQTKFIPRSHAAGEFHLTWPLPPETALVIPFKSRCIVRVGRTSSAGAANSFSGGTILFQGRRWDNEGSVSGAHVRSSVTLCDAWKELEKITFQNAWLEITGTLAAPVSTWFMWPDVTLFAPATGKTYSPPPYFTQLITDWQQIVDIINYATTFMGGPDVVQLQLGATPEFQPSYVSTYPMRSRKCAEALIYCLRGHPGVFTEIDYTTTPPTIHFRNRTSMTAVTLPYKSTLADGTLHIASDIKSLEELKPDAVRLYYKINGTFNGKPAINYAKDCYPTSANSLLCLDYSIDLTGAALKATVVNFVSTPFDPKTLATWRAKVPALRQQVEGGQIPNDGKTGALVMASTGTYNPIANPKGIQVVDETGADIDLTQYLYVTADPVYAWFTVAGAPALAVKATVKAFFAYDKVTTAGGGNVTDTYGEHGHHFRVTLTNAPTNTYTLHQVTAGGEITPPNLAQLIWTELQDLQWKLRHEIIQIGATAASVPTIIKPGKHMVNLSGGAGDWTTMNAVPENVSIAFFRTGNGRLVANHTINCGPVNHLEPGYLIQLANMFINRNRSGIDSSQQATGQSSSQTDLSAQGALENSTSAEPVPQCTNHVYIDPAAPTVIAGQHINDAKLIATILAATTPTPTGGSDATAIKTQQQREIPICMADGTTAFVIGQFTGFYTKP